VEPVADITSLGALQGVADGWKARAIELTRTLSHLESLIAYQRGHIRDLGDELQETQQGYRDLAARVAAIEKECDDLRQ